MAWLFSNPTPDPNNDPAVLQSRYEVRAPDIGPIVSAILQNRFNNAKLQQQQMNDMITGIGKGATMYQNALNENQYQGGQNDAANAAIYGQQYPQDAYGGYTDPNRVPDYGGVDAAQGVKFQNAMIAQQLQDQERIARINRLNNPQSPSSTPNIYTDPDTGQQYYNNSRSGWSPVRGNQGGPNLTNKYGVDPNLDLTDPTQISRVDQKGTPDPSGGYVNIGGTPGANPTDPMVGGQNIPLNAYVAAARRAQQRGQPQAQAQSAPGAVSSQPAPGQQPAVSTDSQLQQDTRDAQAAIATGRISRDEAIARLQDKYKGTDFSDL